MDLGSYLFWSHNWFIKAQKAQVATKWHSQYALTDLSDIHTAHGENLLKAQEGLETVCLCEG